MGSSSIKRCLSSSLVHRSGGFSPFFRRRACNSCFFMLLSDVLARVLEGAFVTWAGSAAAELALLLVSIGSHVALLQVRGREKFPITLTHTSIFEKVPTL